VRGDFSGEGQPAFRARFDGDLLASDPVHYVTKHLQQGIESDHFRVKKNMPKVGGFRSFNSAKKSIAGFEAMRWFKKGFGFTGQWSVRAQNDLLAVLFGIEKVNEA
jgi:hypothetical protein